MSTRRVSPGDQVKLCRINGVAMRGNTTFAGCQRQGDERHRKAGHKERAPEMRQTSLWSFV